MRSIPDDHGRGSAGLLGYSLTGIEFLPRNRQFPLQTDGVVIRWFPIIIGRSEKSRSPPAVLMSAVRSWLLIHGVVLSAHILQHRCPRYPGSIKRKSVYTGTASRCGFADGDTFESSRQSAPGSIDPPAVIGRYDGCRNSRIDLSRVDSVSDAISARPVRFVSGKIDIAICSLSVRDRSPGYCCIGIIYSFRTS